MYIMQSSYDFIQEYKIRYPVERVLDYVYVLQRREFLAPDKVADATDLVLASVPVKNDNKYYYLFQTEADAAKFDQYLRTIVN